MLEKRKKRAPPVGAPGGKGNFRGSPPKKKKKSVDSGVDLGGRGVSGGLPLRRRKKSVHLGVHLGPYSRVCLGAHLGVLSSNSPPGIHKLFTTGKSHAPAHIKLAVAERVFDAWLARLFQFFSKYQKVDALDPCIILIQSGVSLIIRKAWKPPKKKY